MGFNQLDVWNQHTKQLKHICVLYYVYIRECKSDWDTAPTNAISCWFRVAASSTVWCLPLLVVTGENTNLALFFENLDLVEFPEIEKLRKRGNQRAWWKSSFFYSALICQELLRFTTSVNHLFSTPLLKRYINISISQEARWVYVKHQPSFI